MRARLLLSVAILIAVIAVSSMLSNVYAVASDEYVFDFKFGSEGSGDGQFRYPRDVTYDHNNNRIIVADTGNHRIQVFDTNGNFLFKFGNFGFDDGQFNYPFGVAYDHNNNRIIVADTFNDRIQVFDTNGNFLFKFGNFGYDDGQFFGPFGVAYDPNNNRIIVADTDNYRIQVFSPKYSLTLYEGSNPSDGVINLGDDITAKATTNDSSVVNVKFRWIDPSNNEVRTNTVNIVSGEASDTYTPNQVGTWKVVAEFSNGTIVVKELQVPFQVVPESIIGALSVIGSSLAVLAVYRRKRSI
jgi:DNA-binding beta-propeller fold protein YncE